MCDNRFGVDVDSFDRVIEKVLVFRSNTDKVIWSDDLIV